MYNKRLQDIVTAICLLMVVAITLFLVASILRVDNAGL